MIPCLRSKPKSPAYVVDRMFLFRTTKLGGGCVMILALVMCGGAFAQQATVLTNVTIVDGTGSPAQHNRTVVVKADRIESIGAGHEHPPSSAKVIDLHGQTIMPLIINTPGHLGLTKVTLGTPAIGTDD